MRETLPEAETDWHIDIDAEARIIGALEVIHKALGTMTDRELVSAAEVSDILLDARSALVNGDS